MAEAIEPGGGDPRAAAAAAVSPDPATAELLAKHSAGQPLTQSEYGKLGAFASRLKKFFGNGQPGPGPAQPGPGPGQPARLGPLAAVEASDPGLAPVPVDADLVKRTTAGVLKSADTIARRYVGREARKAGADDKTAARFDSAVRLPDASQELLVDTSPEILAAMGLDPRTYPIAVAVGCLGLWGTNLWMAIDELKSMQKEVIPVRSTVTQATTVPVSDRTLPDPARPAGAPPDVRGKGRT